MPNPPHPQPQPQHPQPRHPQPRQPQPRQPQPPNLGPTKAPRPGAHTPVPLNGEPALEPTKAEFMAEVRDEAALKPDVWGPASDLVRAAPAECKTLPADAPPVSP